jgi:uncharacterized protein YceH (UPF0502 family)
MSSITRQDMQTMLDQACRRMQDQLATRQDVQRSADNARDRMISYMHDFMQQNQQQLIRNMDDRTRMYKAIIANLESRMQSLEQEVRASRQLLSQMARKQKNIVIPNIQVAAGHQQPQQPYRYAQQEA